MKSYVEGLSEGAMEVGPPSREFLAWLTRHAVPPTARHFLAHAWVKGDDDFLGAMTLMSEAAIMARDAKEPRWLAAGFLVIGSCDNGDMVALDTKAALGSVWFLSHEELWGDETADPRRFAVRVAKDLGELAVKGQDLDAFPYDYEDARERAEG